MITEHIALDPMYMSSHACDVKNTAEVANMVQYHLHLAQGKAGRLFWYNDGIYTDSGERAIAEMYVRILTQYNRLKDWKYNIPDHLARLLLATVPNIDDKPELTLLNLKNGLLDWQAGCFEPHKPDYLNTVRIPITYDPNAECPVWEDFLDDILPVRGGKDFLMELIGLCMIPLTSLQKSIVLVGTGSNGKSTYLNGLMAAIGKDNCSHIPLHDIADRNKRFVTARLLGKLVNVVGDISMKELPEVSRVKEIIGEDSVEAEFKGQQMFRFTPFARLIFSSNAVIRSEDSSDGYKRRFLHVPFTRQFNVDPSKGKELADVLSSPRELSGLLNHIVLKLPQIVEGGFTFTPEMAEIIDNWVPMHENTKKWFREKIVADPNGKIPATGFYSLFAQYCPNDPNITHGKAIQFMKIIHPYVTVGKNIRVNGYQVRCYVGVRMRDPEEQKYVESFKGDDLN